MHRIVAFFALLLSALALNPSSAFADPADIEAAARGVEGVAAAASDGDDVVGDADEKEEAEGKVEVSRQAAVFHFPRSGI